MTTDITKLAYEKITDRYYKARYLGLECIMDITNGYINGTKLCLSAKDKSKKILNYIDRMRCKLLINYYMSNIIDYSADLSVNVVDGIKEIRGTYLHPILFLDLAIWISPAAYMKANTIITENLLKNKEESCVNEKLTILEKNQETIVKIIIENNEKIQNSFGKSLENIENDNCKIKLSLKRLETKIDTKLVEPKIVEPKIVEPKPVEPKIVNKKHVNIKHKIAWKNCLFFNSF
jgi:hypothetical protein